MSVVPEELDTRVDNSALCGVTRDENSPHLPRSAESLDTRVEPGSLQAACSGDPVTDHPFVD